MMSCPMIEAYWEWLLLSILHPDGGICFFCSCRSQATILGWWILLSCWRTFRTYMAFPAQSRPSISIAASPNRLQEVLRNRSLPPRCLRHRSLQCRYQGGEEADLLNQLHHACCWIYFWKIHFLKYLIRVSMDLDFFPTWAYRSNILMSIFLKSSISIRMSSSK